MTDDETVTVIRAARAVGGEIAAAALRVKLGLPAAPLPHEPAILDPEARQEVVEMYRSLYGEPAAEWIAGEMRDAAIRLHTDRRAGL